MIIRIFQVCAAAVGVVADLCRALEVKMVPHLNEIMEMLVVCLQVKIYKKNLDKFRRFCKEKSKFYKTIILYDQSIGLETRYLCT